MKRVLIAAAIAGLAFLGWRWNEKQAATERACEILGVFQQERRLVSAEEAAALYALANETYEVRLATLATVFTWRRRPCSTPRSTSPPRGCTPRRCAG